MPIPLFIFQKETHPYRGAVLLESFVPHRVRRWLLDIVALFVIFFFILSFGFLSYTRGITGLLFLTLAILLKLIALEAYYYSARFRRLQREPYLFELSLLMGKIGSKDFVGDFIRSHEGKLILIRAGLRQELLTKYLHERAIHIPFSAVSFPESATLFESFVRAVYRADASFTYLLIVHGLTEDEFVEAAKFAMVADRVTENKRRWWHVGEKHTRAQQKLIRSILHFEKQSTMHMSHGAYSIVQNGVDEGFTPSDLEELFVELAEHAIENGRSVIVREDVLER